MVESTRARTIWWIGLVLTAVCSAGCGSTEGDTRTVSSQQLGSALEHQRDAAANVAISEAAETIAKMCRAPGDGSAGIHSAVTTLVRDYKARPEAAYLDDRTNGDVLLDAADVLSRDGCSVAEADRILAVVP